MLSISLAEDGMAVLFCKSIFLMDSSKKGSKTFLITLPLFSIFTQNFL